MVFEEIERIISYYKNKHRNYRKTDQNNRRLKINRKNKRKLLTKIKMYTIIRLTNNREAK